MFPRRVKVPWVRTTEKKPQLWLIFPGPGVPVLSQNLCLCLTSPHLWVGSHRYLQTRHPCLLRNLPFVCSCLSGIPAPGVSAAPWTSRAPSQHWCLAPWCSLSGWWGRHGLERRVTATHSLCHHGSQSPMCCELCCHQLTRTLPCPGCTVFSVTSEAVKPGDILAEDGNGFLCVYSMVW